MVGQTWLDALPELLDRLGRQWSCTLGRGLPGGSASYVCAARTSAGDPRVIKVSAPVPEADTDVAAEAAFLRRADGVGAARLHAYDAGSRALLLEALGPSLERSGRPPTEQIAITGSVLGKVWRPADPTAAAEPAKAHRLAADVRRFWAEQDRPCPVAVIDQAQRCAEARVADHRPDRAVWLHGDPHPGNLLAAPPRPGAEAGYVVIDPSPFADDRAYDLGVLLRDWSNSLGSDPAGWLRTRCAELAARTGVDAEAIWQWAYLERVSTGLYVGSFGAHAVARPFLDSAAALL